MARLLDTANPNTKTDPRVFVIRRVTGHLRLDGDLWTFMYLCDPYVDMRDAQFSTSIPGGVQRPLDQWMDDYVVDQSPEAFIDDLCTDGFGFVLGILREIKTSWKLFLNEMEVFLEDLVRLSVFFSFDHPFASYPLRT